MTFQVQKAACSTCIYRKDSPLDLEKLEGEIADAYGGFNGYRECHHAAPGSGVCCRGFWNRHKDRFAAGQVKGDSHQIWRTQREQVNLASLRLFLRSSTGPNRAFEPQSLGRVLDPVRIAEGPTHDFGLSILGFGLRTETTRVSSPQAPARGEEFLVDSLHEGERTGPPTL